MSNIKDLCIDDGSNTVGPPFTLERGQLYRLFSNIVLTTYGLQIDDISPNAQVSGLSKTKEKNSKAKLGAKLEKH